MKITSESILAGLNPPQKAATTHLTGPLLVLAGAGSGKTRVITHRIAYMLSRGIAPEHILAMSFTNKAAGEMRERASAMVGPQMARRLHLSTFHSMGADLLRTYIRRMGWRPPFTILDQGDQVQIVKNILEEEGLTQKGVDPRKVHAIISRAKNAFCEPKRLGGAMRFNPLATYAQKVYTRYVETSKALNAVDFDDLITLPVHLLQQHPDVLAEVRERYQYVMVDEYQDTNETQLMLLGLICNPRNNLCAVGDDDQSIYAFRGAVAQNILDFDKQFPGARVIKLEQNYRSTTVILQAANAVIANNRQRRDKTLWSATLGGDRIKYFELEDEEEEAGFVAGDIHRLRAEEQRPWRDFSILMRVSVLGRTFEEALRSLDIPYKLVGGGSFFDRREVKDLVAYLQVILNPANEVSLRRIINTPRRGIGTTALEHISTHASTGRMSMSRALREAADGKIETLTPAQRRGIGELLEVIDEFGQRFRSGERLDEVLEALIERIDYEDFIMSTEKSEKVARIRLANIREIVSSLGAFQDRQGDQGLEGYLSRLTLDGGTSSTQKEDEDADEVTLMTLHASKGLEFPDVYLVGFEEEILPHARSLEVGGDGDLEEERRLAYVAITRAKRRLVITSARTRGRGQASRKRKVSRFLAEIPDDVIQRMGYDPYRRNEATKAARKAQLAKMRAILFDD